MVGYLGRLGEGFQARAHAARALKVPHVTRGRYVTERVNPVWAINWTHVTQATVLFRPCGSLVLGCNCDISLGILSSKTTIFSVVWFMDLVEDYVGTACGSLDWW